MPKLPRRELNSRAMAPRRAGIENRMPELEEERFWDKQESGRGA
jgi:hypothetical protein